MVFWRLSALALIGALCLPSTGRAAPKEFDFKDPKGVNAVIVTLDSVLEPIAGIARGVTGMVRFDPEKPAETAGKIIVDVNTLEFPNERYTTTAQGERGMDADRFPNIEFTLKSVKSVKKGAPNVFEGMVVGDFSMHGVTKSVTIPMKATYLPGKAAERNRGAAGDLLVLRTTFPIKRSEFNVAPRVAAELIAEEIEVRVALVGVAPATAAAAAR